MFHIFINEITIARVNVKMLSYFRTNTFAIC